MCTGFTPFTVEEISKGEGWSTSHSVILLLAVPKRLFCFGSLMIYRVLRKFEDITLAVITSAVTTIHLKTSQVSRTIQYQGIHNVRTFTIVLYCNKIRSLYPRGQTDLPFIIDVTY